MGGTITGLRFQRKATDRVNVYLDGEFAFGLPGVLAARLRPGQQLSDAEIEQLGHADVIERTLDRAIHLLSFRPRSEAELRQRLVSAGVPAPAIDVACEELSRRGYLDDAEFARFWVQDRLRFRPKGARALRQELRTRGVANDAIEQAIGELNPLEDAYRAVKARAARMADLARSDPRACRMKLTGYLQRRGFDYSVVREVVDRLMVELAGPDGESAE